MPHTPPNLTALLGSRICHDLINPLGAIGNGIELLGLSGVVAGEEMDLVTDSVQNATAKLKFMRLAFGEASADQVVARSEILTTLEAVASGGRLSYSWNVAGDPARFDVRVALLSVMCVETALPLGGDIDVTMADGRWTVSAKHERLSLDAPLWATLTSGTIPLDLKANQVHFGLLPDMAERAGRSIAMRSGEDWVEISF